MNFRRFVPEIRWQSCLSPVFWISPALALLVFLLNLWLNAPLFMSGELPFRGSVMGGYVSMSRFLSEHPNPWGWNPLPYCGLPVQFMYVPVLPYLSALGIRLLPHVSPDQVFRSMVSLAACLGPVTLFFFALYFTRSRRWALVTALAYSFLSPSYGLFPAVEKDRGIVQLPWRIQVLAKYGEGPHNTGLTLLPIALLALWLAGKRRGTPRILLAAVLLAAIPLCNWVAAFALAISCLLLLLAACGEPEFQPFLALALAEGFRLTLKNSNQTVRLCAWGSGGLLLLAGLPQLWAYATQGWHEWLPLAPESTIEYQLAHWIAEHPPQGRVFASGGLRFRLNSWFDIQQVGGGFETGLRNRVPVDLAWGIRTAGNLWPGHEAEDTLSKLKALGAGYVVVHGSKSQEYYRDFVRPERMAAALQPLYHTADDTIYALPPRRLAYLVRPEEIPNSDVREHHDALTRYVAAIEDPSRPELRSEWIGTSTLAMTGAAPPGYLVAV